MPPLFVCSGDGTGQIVIPKTKIKPVSINVAANCDEHILWPDDAMLTLFAQCSWPNYLIICWQMISWLTVPQICSYHYSCIFFSTCHEQNLVWKYERLSSIPFLKFSIPLHSGIFNISYRNFRFIPSSISFHALTEITRYTRCVWKVTGLCTLHEQLLSQRK